jgi:hypothetical protein
MAGMAERLRHEAARALRLSREIGDRQAAEALATHAANLLERAEALERQEMPPPQPSSAHQQPAQQQQQSQPKKEK